jgi:hypothetical protein
MVLAVNAYLVMDAKPGVAPARQPLDQGVVNLALPPQHREDLVSKELLEFLEINVRDDIQPAVGCKEALRDDGMQMRVEVHQIAEGLNRHDHAGDCLLFAQGGLEEGLHTGVGTLAEFAQ